MIAKLHDGATAKILFDLAQRNFKRLELVLVYFFSFHLLILLAVRHFRTA